MADFIYRGFKAYRLYKLLEDGTFDKTKPLSYGKLLADTVKITPASPTTNDIFEEGDPVNPVISDDTPGVTNIAMTLMQQDPKVRRDLLGETLTMVDNRVVAADFGDVKQIFMAIELENRNGLIKRFNRIKVNAMDEGNYLETAFMQLPVNFKVMKPLNAALPVKETIYPVGVIMPDDEEVAG
ncbi:MULTISPECIES: hypothetical protein [Olivibacter]|uniref:Uncharacterized protein n=1 Tax=Olivibacter jilunii TaxID=985016 RepID=A0ABW6AZF6_9SPHI